MKRTVTESDAVDGQKARPDPGILRAIYLSVFVLLSGCGNLNQLVNNMDASLGQIVGTYSAPTLAGSPRPNPSCSDQRCRTLDGFESIIYQKARSGEITWVRLVDAFYDARRRVYPQTSDGPEVYELQSFQRALAEQLDAGRITEAQWAYLNDRKTSELVQRMRQSTTTCSTTNIGSIAFPNYQTTCR